MYLEKLVLKKLRCFNNLELNFSPKINLIEGLNGSGKTSILEALHYLCYLRSFRTYFTKELISFDAENFFIKADFLSNDNLKNTLQVGFSKDKRSIKINQKNISSYKDLLNIYKSISLVEDDLNLIKSGPQDRRDFLDQYIALSKPEYIILLREYKKILANRNAYLKQNSKNINNYSKIINQVEFKLWTDNLNQKSLEINKLREEKLALLNLKVNHLLNNYFSNEKLNINLVYKPKNLDLKSLDLDRFYLQELRYQRTMFGAHLSDFAINFGYKRSKLYASRGQQKLIILLLKIAQKQILGSKPISNIKPENNIASFSDNTILLLDDFMTDLDHSRLEILVNILMDLKSQLIFTCPTQAKSPIRSLLLSKKAKIIKL